MLKSLSLVLICCLSAHAGFFSSAKKKLHKVGDEVHDAGVSLGKEIDKKGDTVTHEILKDGKVVGQAVVKGGKIVEEKTVKDGKVVGSEAITGAHFLVKDGKIVGREIEHEGKVVGTEVIKAGKVVEHTLADMLAPIPMPGDFPPPAAKKTAEQRLKDCETAKTPECYAKHEMPLEAGIPKNCFYGWSVGAGHPSSNSNPPDYEKTLNALDQCAWFHDRGAWKYNPITKVCEDYRMCSNSMGLKRCMDRVKPRNAVEAAAKECFTKYFGKVMEACVPDLYVDYGAELDTDPKSGEQWLSAKSVAMLRATMKKCPSPMKNPGFAGL